MLPASRPCADSPHTADSAIPGHAPAPRPVLAPLPLPQAPACFKPSAKVTQPPLLHFYRTAASTSAPCPPTTGLNLVIHPAEIVSASLHKALAQKLPLRAASSMHLT